MESPESIVGIYALIGMALGVVNLWRHNDLALRGATGAVARLVYVLVWMVFWLPAAFLVAFGKDTGV